MKNENDEEDIIMSDSIGLKVTEYTSMATCVTVIRKYRNASMGEIVSAIKNNEYVLCFDYDDDYGLKKIIACYKALCKAKIGAQLYEMDDEPTTLEFMQNLNGTYRQISEKVDGQMGTEAEN